MSDLAGERFRVSVIGDGAVDLFLEEVPHHADAGASSHNWQRSPGHRIHRLDGGALLLGTMIAEATGLKRHRHPASRETFIQSLATIELAKAKDDDRKSEDSLRVSRFLGFEKPDGALSPAAPTHIGAAEGASSILVVDNAGNGFREQRQAWEPYLSPERTYDLIVVKTNAPLPRESEEGELWRAFVMAKASKKIIVVNARDLRNAGVETSFRLSWDRSCEDLRQQLDRGTLKILAGAGTVVVRFGLEGAAIIDDGKIAIVCEPGSSEGDAEFAVRNRVPGLTSAFTATLVSCLSHGEESIAEAVHSALAVARRLFGLGFIKDVDRKLVVPFKKLFERADPNVPKYLDGIKRCELEQLKGPPTAEVTPLRLRGWSAETGDDRLARRILLDGVKHLDDIPHAAIGDLLIADRTEVENYRSIANLMSTYASDPKRDKPLSIAVFGAPGSGKSFGIKSIAKALNETGRAFETIEPNEFNVAQWNEPRDLVEALHVARDRRIAGQLPLVFFDEFDSDDCKWLKSFLAPMQDGAFKDGAHNHTVDRAIFIFAGGTAEQMDRFNVVRDRQKAKDQKRPDFISRLSGYVDVSSINDPSVEDPMAPADEQPVATSTAGTPAASDLRVPRTAATSPEFGYRLRRAIVLRGIFERKYPHLIDRDRVLQIDDDVLNAFLTVPRFHHGVRSIEAILRMSDLTSHTSRFARSALPSDAQIRLHTDERAFSDALHA